MPKAVEQIERKATGDQKPRHAFCIVCNGEPISGTPITALCGYVKPRENERRLNQIPPNACLVCEDLLEGHVKDHLFKGEIQR